MKEKIFEAIRRFDTIIIHRHVRPDPDAYGSQGGLAEILKATYPEKRVFAAGKGDPGLDFLMKMDEVPADAYRGALVIVCDTANQERICGSRYSSGDMLIKIDHHPNEDPYGDLQWVDTGASSVSEMIFEFFLWGSRKGLKMNVEAARLLYAGIIGDTGRFLYPSTTKRTLEYAAQLIEFPFDRSRLHDDLYELKANVMKLQGYVYDHFKMLPSGAASVILTKEVLKEYGTEPSEASLLVSTLGNVKGIKAWCFFIEEEDQIRVRLRSKGPVINKIAMKYNGGGHPFAAGASVHTWEEAEQVMRDIRAVCEEG